MKFVLSFQTLIKVIFGEQDNVNLISYFGNLFRFALPYFMALEKNVALSVCYIGLLCQLFLPLLISNKSLQRLAHYFGLCRDARVVLYCDQVHQYSEFEIKSVNL